ncbi:MAG: alanyl-tRNA editing protein [Enterocloster sp.]
MDQNRLYYQTPYVKRFMCTVTGCREGKKGHWLVTLDRTGFYPEGGGQPSDTGTLNGIPVLAVHEKNGEIIHELESQLQPGVQAEGIINWQERYDNMQQHTGEHILSGLVHRHYGYNNVGFHMGSDEVTVDFDGLLDQEQLDALEDEANALVYANIPVRVLYPTEEELKDIDYRSKKELTGQVRIVDIPGGDICACCGTHVENTGEVGIIKIRSMIHYKGGVRISMLCGRRAMLDYRERLRDETAVSVMLSAKLALVPQAVEKLKNENQEKSFLMGRLYQKLFELKAQSYPESDEPLAVFEEELSPVQLRQMATLLYEQKKGSVVGVFSGNEEAGEYQYALGSRSLDMRSFSKVLNGNLNGRGGGSSLMAQGTFRAGKDEIEEAFRKAAKECLWNLIGKQ